MSKTYKELINEYLTRNQTASDFFVKDFIIHHKFSSIIVQDESIDVLDLTCRSYNALHRGGIRTLSALINTSTELLYNIKNLGKRCGTEIIDKLNQYLYEKVTLNTENIEQANNIDINSIMNAPIDSLNLSSRIKNRLNQFGIITIKQLDEINLDTLKSIRYFGVKALEEIIQAKENIHILISSEISDNIQEEVVANFVKNLGTLGLSEDDMKTYSYYLISAVNRQTDTDDYYKIWYNEIHVHNFIEDYLIKLFSKHTMFGLSLDEVYSYFIKFNHFDYFMNYFVTNRLELVQDNKYILKTQSFRDILIKSNSEKTSQIVIRHINGETLANIASSYNISRERTRQLQATAFHKVKSHCIHQQVNIRENRFKPIFEKYNLTQELFVALTGQSTDAYNYLQIVTKKGTKSSKDIINDCNIPTWMKNNLKMYLNNTDYICINNIIFKKTQVDIAKYVLSSKYKDNDVTFAEFIEAYQAFLNEHNLNNNKNLSIILENKSKQMSHIADYSFVLRKYGKKMRYYDINSYDFTELLQTLNLNQYHNTQISTLKFINDYPELMKKYDIRDEYELHNLLKKIGFGKNDPSIKMNMPYIKFGNFNKYVMIKDMMYKYAPIREQDLAIKIYEEYGFKINIIISWLGSLKDYLHNGIYYIN